MIDCRKQPFNKTPSLLRRGFAVHAGRAWLPLLDEFRTQNWRQIKEELGTFMFTQKMSTHRVVG